MEWEKLLKDLINLVESTAPHIWEIAIRQIYVHCIDFGIAIVALSILGVLFAYSSIWIYKEEGEPKGIFILPLLFAILAFGLCPIFLANIIGRLINPEYYAIELLINYVK